MSPSEDRSLSDLPARRTALEEEIRRSYGERLYPLAHSLFDEWWKLGDFGTSDTALLTLLADLCNRVGDVARGDLLEAHLAEHGTAVQRARALRILGRRWMGTPKQLRLRDLYAHALEHHPELRDDLEIEALGRQLTR
jgi:hypothetical protein